jgi:FtsP/CotA-like multicopper oxidase with cupredoxin domain
VIILAVVVALLGAIGYFWVDSFVPSTYSVMDMGYPDLGGGLPGIAPMASMPDMPGTVSVASLAGPAIGAPDVAITLVARKETFRLASGQKVSGYTLNHTSPGPTIRATQGDLLQVTLVNESVPDGVTLHWHGIDVPNAEDGVAGVTQDAVPVGGQFVYRFRLDDAGTYWYHSHQDSSAQIPGGLYGALIVEPAAAPPAHEAIAMLHTYGDLRATNGATGLQRVDAPAGETMRVRAINTDNDVAGLEVSGATFKLVSHDGRDVNNPTDLDGTSVVVPAGGRVDIAFQVPADVAVRVDLGSGAGLLVGPPGAPEAPEPPLSGALNLLKYGSPAPIGFDPSHPARQFQYKIGKRFGFEGGVPGVWWTVNGHLYPDVPMFEVSEGDVVVMTIVNQSGVLHPMHLHGHHAVVLSRDGQPVTGSPWWFDSLDVESDSTYVIAFVADNPGVWMDHCHNLHHAADGLVSHLAYTNIVDPYEIGGKADNHPA